MAFLKYHTKKTLHRDSLWTTLRVQHFRTSLSLLDVSLYVSKTQQLLYSCSLAAVLSSSVKQKCFRIEIRGLHSAFTCLFFCM